MGCGRDIYAIFGRAPDALCRIDEHGWLGLSGEVGSADLNLAAVIRGAHVALVNEYVGEMHARGLEAILIVDEEAEDLRAAALSLGLTEVGTAPVMVWEGGLAPVSPGRYLVRRGQTSDLAVAGGLVAEAFSLDKAKVQRVLPESILAAVDLWLVEDAGCPVGMGLFVRSNDHVGIYCMATSERFQRRGIGRALLVAAIAHYVQKDAKTFTLEATEAGFHLYEQIGFRTFTMPFVFLLGASTQFPG